VNLIRLAIARPVAVLAVVLLVVLAGLVALREIPIQLAPDIDRPVISVETPWPGAAPEEVEREIVNRQEDVLRDIEGVTEMRSNAREGSATVTLEFAIDQDMSRALLLVANRLDRVTGYPDEADEPILRTSGPDDQPMAWFILHRVADNARPIETYGDFADDVVRSRMERIEGVAHVTLMGNVERELKVVVDPAGLARYGLTVPDVVRVLRQANVSMTVGDVKEGKRRYVVRSEGELTTPERIRAVVLRSITDPETGRVARVRLADVAEVGFGYKERTVTIRQMGRPALILSAVRTIGANVMETMAGIRAAVEELNAGPLAQEGLKLKLVFDETDYVRSALDLVRENIWLGIVLAAGVLLLFLRSWQATAIVMLAVPISIVGTFVAMAALGRTLNVISLAGIAFAVGMLVDAAIVVLDNIDRLHREGRTPAQAALAGAHQVWGANLAAALTTVVVFVPLLILNLEVGQLFRDIAVAITASVLLSLVVAITVVPTLAARLLRAGGGQSRTPIRLPVVDRACAGFVDLTLKLTQRSVNSRLVALCVVLVVCGASTLATWLFLPQREYLPEGNRNLVQANLQPPPGYNLAATSTIADAIEAALRPLWVMEAGDSTADRNGLPAIDHFFFTAYPTSTFVGAQTVDPERVRELIPVFQEAVFKEPGTYGFVQQPSIFGRSVSGARGIDLHISGPDIEVLLAVAQRAVSLIEADLPRAEGTQIRPLPGLEMGAPEIRLYPDPIRLADNGLTTREFSETIDAFNDGLRVAEVSVDGDRIDLVLSGPEDQAAATQTIGQLPVITASGLIVPASSLADIVMTAGPIQIRHRERQRTITLQIRPAPALALQTAIERVQSHVIERLQAEGLPTGVRLTLAGTADRLSQTWAAMVWQVLLAIVVVYLILAILMESMTLPAIIIVSVPLATAGGIAGLAVVNLFVRQPFDMLTMLGFVILVGTVVNNAILIAYQTLHHIRDDKLPTAAAISEATSNRIRPIFMSTLTNVVGMLPLVLFPGAGSELYRGIGSVVIGGLSLSAILTLALIPALLSLVLPHTRTGGSARAAVVVPERHAAE